MELKWTSKALSDLARLHEFLALVDRSTAARTVQSLAAAPVRLLEQPLIGEKLEEFEPREVRRILVGHYELRYDSWVNRLRAAALAYAGRPIDDLEYLVQGDGWHQQFGNITEQFRKMVCIRTIRREILQPPQ